MSNLFTLRCESCGGQLSAEEYPLTCRFCGAENWAKDTFSFSEQRAVANLRLIHSAQSTFAATFGCGSYASAGELFRYSFIPPQLAEACNVPKMTNEAGLQCDGENAPLAGYRYRFETHLPSEGRQASFLVVAGVDTAVHKKGIWNFFIDESGVIRFASIQEELPNAESKLFDTNLEQRMWS